MFVLFILIKRSIIFCACNLIQFPKAHTFSSCNFVYTNLFYFQINLFHLGEKDEIIGELQEQFKKAHHYIAQIHYENREMKKKLSERFSIISTPKYVSMSKTKSSPTVTKIYKRKGK
jgi:hypothetical protein